MMGHFRIAFVHNDRYPIHIPPGIVLPTVLLTITGTIVLSDILRRLLGQVRTLRAVAACVPTPLLGTQSALLLASGATLLPNKTMSFSLYVPLQHRPSLTLALGSFIKKSEVFWHFFGFCMTGRLEYLGRQTRLKIWALRNYTLPVHLARRSTRVEC